MNKNKGELKEFQMRTKNKFKINKVLFLFVLLVLFTQGFSEIKKAFAETYLDEEVQKVWWTGGDTGGTKKALLDFTSGANPTISTWTKKSAYTSLTTVPIQQGGAHYVDPLTGTDLKGINRIYFDGPPGTGTQLGATVATAYDRNQPVVIGKAPHKGADYVFAFRNDTGTYNISAELYDARKSEAYGVGTTTPKLVKTTSMSSINGSSLTILPGADPSYYWVVGVDHVATAGAIISYKVSADNPNGVSTTPVRTTMDASDLGIEFRNMMPWNSETNGIAQPGGTSKLVISDYVSNGGQVWVYDFNRTTGTATQRAKLTDIGTYPSGFVRILGASSDFSPSGKYVYFTSGSAAYYGRLYRWDYDNKILELVPNQTRNSGYVQTARNGKMYVNHGYPDYQPQMGEIIFPDAANIADVGYVENRYTLPVSTTSMDGLAGETIAT